MDADAVDIRVLGCLIEKQRTTPDAYPLSLNALRLACNQSTNREPVVGYDESTIRAGLKRLSRKGWTRLASGAGSRAAKYRHLLDDAIGLSGEEISVLTILMLRGAQTPGELKQRTERLHSFASLRELGEALDALIKRELVASVPRQPGQKEERYEQLLGAGTQPGVTTVAGADEEINRIEALEERVTQLEEVLAALRARSGLPNGLTRRVTRSQSMPTRSVRSATTSSRPAPQPTMSNEPSRDRRTSAPSPP